VKKLAAEFLGTFWLVFCGCGSALIAANFPAVGIGLLGVSLAFGLTVLTMAYAVGRISGGHFNPAVSVGMVVGGRMSIAELPGYVVVQVLGAAAAAALLYFIASSRMGFVAAGFTSNGYDTLSPGGYGMQAAAAMEAVMTAFFVFVILATTAKKAASGMAPLAIGLTLTLIHLVSIPVTNTSVNPARSTGVALFADTAALSQLWLFWAAPIIGAVIGAMIWKGIYGDTN
jgi:aquaporin Z